MFCSRERKIFTQTLNPAGNMWLTVLLALVPLAVLLLLLAIVRLTAWLAALIAGAVALALGALVWHAPWGGMLRSYCYGALSGAWVIDWITLWGLVIFNTLVVTGDFARFKSWMVHHATADIRVQTIMLAWAFGALGVPILALSVVTSLPVMALSASVGNIVAVLALLPPWVLIYLVSGWRGVREAWLLAVVGSLSYIAGQWPVAHYLGPYLPDLSGALVSFWVLFGFVKLWSPKTIRGFGGLPLELMPSPAETSAPTSLGSAFSVWLPYIVLIAVVVAWTGPWSHLPSISLFHLSETALSSVTQKAIASTFNFNPLGGGTSILASWLVILALLRPGTGALKQVFAKTFHQIWGALIVALFVFALAYTFVYTGMANSLAYGLSKTGVLFVALAPILGWIGVALSGSNTSTNAMFGPVQAVTGKLLNLPVLLLPTLNSLGAEVGKPIAPQTASVGVSTSKFVRSEGAVIRHNMAWTLIVLVYLIGIGLLFYFVFPQEMTVPGVK